MNLLLLVSFFINTMAIKMEVFVMSKCPDAYYTESFIHNVRSSMHEKERESLDLNLDFITNADGTCMHGESECLGNRLLLSVESLSSADILDFVVKYNQDPKMSLDSVKGLLSTLNASDGEINDVMDLYESDDSKELLSRSAAYTKSLSITKSATVRVNGRIIAIRDSDSWAYLNGVDSTEESWVRYLHDLSTKGGL